MGWSVPFLLYKGSPAQVPACPGAATDRMLTGYLGPKGDPAQCTTCTVGQPHGSSCFAGVTAYTDAACSEDPSMLLFGLDFCNPIGDNEFVAGAGTAPPSAEYYCDVPEQTPTVPPMSWDTAAVGCAAPSPQVNGCGANNLCVAAPTAPFQSKMCISKTGDRACPTQTYTARSVFYTAAVDGRTCTPCGYTRTPITCTATAVMYSDSMCGSAIGTVTDFSGACGNLPGTVGSTKMLGATFSGTPSCSAVGGQPMGSIAPTGPVTVCCKP